MKKAFLRKRLLPVLSTLAVLISAFSCMTMLVSAESVNLKEYIASAIGVTAAVKVDSDTGEVSNVTSASTVDADSYVEQAFVNGLFDGTINSSSKPNGTSKITGDSPRVAGVLITLQSAMDVEELSLYSGHQTVTNGTDVLQIFAGVDLGSLYTAGNLVDEGSEYATYTGSAQGAPIVVKVESKVQYIAIFKINNGTWRGFEFDVIGDPGSESPIGFNQGTAPIVNLRSHISGSGLTAAVSKGSVNKTIATASGAHTYIGSTATIAKADVSTDDVNSYAPQTFVEKLYDGDTSTRGQNGITKLVDSVSAGNALDNPVCGGVLYTLDSPLFVDKLSLYSGHTTYNDQPDVLQIFAAETLDELYDIANQIASGVECVSYTSATNNVAKDVEVGRTVQYIAIFQMRHCGANSHQWRAWEYEVWGSEAVSQPDEEPEEPVVDTEEELNAALAEAEAMPDVIGATISTGSAQNILFKSEFNNVQQTVDAYSLVEYGIIVLPTQYITDTNRKEGAALEYGNKYVATAKQTVANGEEVTAIPEFSAELRGSAQGVYPGVNFSYRAYMIYEKADGEQAIVYSALDDEHAVRSVWGIARAIAEAILGDAELKATITETESIKRNTTAAELEKIKSEVVYDFICKNVNVVAAYVAKIQQ